MGLYSADIVAIDVGSGRRLVIENQFGRADHDHLGKSLVYAAVLGATNVIWGAERFTDEHRRALDWHNEYTTDEVGFYGVQLTEWRRAHAVS